MKLAIARPILKNDFPVERSSFDHLTSKKKCSKTFFQMTKISGFDLAGPYFPLFTKFTHYWLNVFCAYSTALHYPV